MMRGRSLLRSLGVVAVAAVVVGGDCGNGRDPSHGETLVVRLETATPGSFVSVDAAGAVSMSSPHGDDPRFYLIDLDGPLLDAGDEVLLRSLHGRYLRVDAGAAGSPLASTTDGYSRKTDCRAVFAVESAAGVDGALANGAEVRLRAFVAAGAAADAACFAPDKRDPLVATGVVLFSGGAGALTATGAAGEATAFKLHMDEPVPHEAPRKLSAPFATTRYGMANAVDTARFLDEQARTIPGASTYDQHNGIDFTASIVGFRDMDVGGLAVLAAADGEVLFVDDTHGDRCHLERDGETKVCPGEPPGSLPDNSIVVLHDDGLVAFYVHVMKGSAKVTKGDRVTCGQIIARIGSAGSSSEPHLHFEMRRPHDPRFKEDHGDVDAAGMRKQSELLDPHASQLFERVTGNSNPLWQLRGIPSVTCVDTKNIKQRGDDDARHDRSILAGGAEFDPCDLQFLGPLPGRICGHGYFCNGTYCEWLRADGEPCTDFTQCRSHNCTPDHRCFNAAPPPPPGGCTVRCPTQCRGPNNLCTCPLVCE